MSGHDLSFQKTNVESELVLQKSRLFLQQPLMLPAYGHSVMTKLQTITSLGAVADWAREQLEVLPAPQLSIPISAVVIDKEFLEKLPPPVARAVETIVHAAAWSRVLLSHALPEDKNTPFAAFAADTFKLDKDKPELEAWERMGIDTGKLRDILRRSDNLELQDDELAGGILAGSDKLDLALLLAAFENLSRAVDSAVADLRTSTFTEEFQFETDAPLGKIICGGAGRNAYTNEAFLIIDTGGDDIYLNSAGGANGLVGRPISIVIDLGGNDQFISRQSFSQGAGVFGIGILAALGSNCTFAAKHQSQGAGFFGCGLLVTGQGKQTFEADTFCQGAGMFGAGILWQRSGDTTYRACEMAQGFGGTSGFGLLLDRSGNDLYYAGGKEACGWLPGHYFSLAQGFGYGMRPFAGGGIGVLCDLKGDDRYIADVYGQGASYWYSTGLLLDAEGSDFYQAYQYCQGAGIHLSTGALIDWSGDDQYSAYAICQGGAHDYGVGMLIDRAGNDRYDAVSTAQGSGINNSFAMLLDRAGDDFYAGRDPKQSQAAGHNGGKREYGSVALLLDLAGNDVYSQGQTNNEIWLKPLYGAGLDMEAATNGVAALLRSAEFVEKKNSGSFTPQAFGAGKRLHNIEPVDVHHPIERLLRRSVREADTEEHRKDAEAAWGELKHLGAQALPYLLTRLDGPDVLVRAKIEELIDALGTNSVPALIAGIDKAKNDEVARLCCYFLARFGDQISGVGVPPANPTQSERARRPFHYDQAVRAVLPLIARERTRSTAFYTLGHLHAREAFAPALEALGDQKEIVRLRAAQALGRTLSVGATSSSRPGQIAAGRPLPQQQRQAIPKLIAALDDEMWDVRYAAEDALVAIGKPSVGPQRRAFAKASPRARPHIIAALARLGDVRALSLAKAELRAESPLVRAAVEKQLRDYLNSGRQRR
jgi:HEAT repeat protein